MEENVFAAAVAERASLSKAEAGDLIRATLDELGGQLGGGEIHKLAPDLPDGLAGHLPRHDGGAHPVPLTEFVRRLGQRTGLNEDEVSRGVRATLVTLDQAPDGTYLRHALSQLPAEYRRLSATGT